MGRLTRRYPQWWLVVIVLGAWLALAASLMSALTGPMHHGRAGPDERTGSITRVSHSAIMAVALMTPLVWPNLHFSMQASLWRRRHRAALLFLAGFLAVVIPTEMILSGVHRLSLMLLYVTSIPTMDSVVTLGLLALALAWERLPATQRSLRRCGRTIPLAIRGWRADLDCARFGAAVGRDCAWTCWPSMLIVMHFRSMLLVACIFPLLIARRASHVRAYMWANAHARLARLKIKLTNTLLPSKEQRLIDAGLNR